MAISPVLEITYHLLSWMNVCMVHVCFAAVNFFVVVALRRPT